MKPAPFEYLAPRGAAEAVEALSGEDARVLAGGQSLVLEMNYRTARPARLVDINRVEEFARLDVDRAGESGDGALRVRPLVRHRAFELPVEHAGVGPLARLLSLVAHHIAHPPIRARGTMLGSLAYAHPAAEWPAVATTLGAHLDLAGPDGTRTVAAGDFFTGPFGTVRRPEELLIQARLPLLPEGAGVGFVEHRRTHASFAALAAIAVLRLRDGVVDWVRLGLVNAADRPVRAHAAERALLGQPAGTEAASAARAVSGGGAASAAGAVDGAGAVAGAAEVAGDVDADPRPQPHASIAYQRHAVTVLVRRALDQALRDARVSGDGG
ncbi:hypothetical protein GCM10023322_53040 [Rugosimonospora acidiphila]|uniref:FAD-binding PCMH-type domain-containing protein n=1 Tax=Rugosimonospora acidiphila TaxID=556531 RepID=A0ABP9S8G5_9ACTN